jgi:hypothetical protein
VIAKDLGAKNAGRSYQRLGPPAWQSKLMAIAGQRRGFILPDDAREKLGLDCVDRTPDLGDDKARTK